MFKYFLDGLFKNNPVLVVMLGLCSVVAVSTTVLNSLGMGVAVIFVLTLSNVVISAIRKIVPDSIRIPVFIVVISTFVTIIDYVLHAYTPEIYAQLGIFVPLIVVNCIVLGRAEAFASKYSVWAATLDGFGAGIGYTIVIFVMGVIREILGSGKIFGYTILGEGFIKSPVIYIILPPGGFLVIAFLMGLQNWVSKKK